MMHGTQKSDSPIVAMKPANKLESTRAESVEPRGGAKGDRGTVTHVPDAGPGKRAKRGLGKPQTFDFLGFTHISGHDRRGKFLLQRITRRDRMVAALKRIKEELRRRWHISVHEQGRWLRKVVQGYFGYHAVPGNYLRMTAFRNHVTDLWRRALRRRGQRDRTTWKRAFRLAAEWLPRARVLHPWPNQRFDATHPRQEPGARIVHAGICAGGAR